MLWLALLLFGLSAGQQFLSVDKQTEKFQLNGKPVFLSGMNQPWLNYGSDFGGSQPANGNGYGEYCALQSYLKNISSAGGNSLRFWLFVEGDSIPTFDGNGAVNGTDSTGSLVKDLQRYLKAAQDLNLLVIFTLWNGALMRNSKVQNMVKDAGKLQTFLDKVLTPITIALKDERALGSWEIINEPEGSVVADRSDTNPCFDTTPLKNTGAGWAKTGLFMKDLQRFVNLQADAIHKADPKALVTVGSWSEHAITTAFPANQGYYNYWSDSCLKAAGGKIGGTLDWMQVHSYAFNGQFGLHAPFHQVATDYKIGKPVVVGEFASTGSPMSSSQQYQYLHEKGYAGAWGWSAIGGSKVDNMEILTKGVESIRSQSDVPIDIKGTTPADKCSCSDVAPDSQYTCAQQAGWGKCMATFMQGHCCRSCHACKGCT